MAEARRIARLRRENARLKRQLLEKDMLAELLKKVQEFEGMKCAPTTIGSM